MYVGGRRAQSPGRGISIFLSRNDPARLVDSFGEEVTSFFSASASYDCTPLQKLDPLDELKAPGGIPRPVEPLFRTLRFTWTLQDSIGLESAILRNQTIYAVLEDRKHYYFTTTCTGRTDTTGFKQSDSTLQWFPSVMYFGPG